MFRLVWAIDWISSALLFVCVVLASVFFVLSRPFIVILYCERLLINPTTFISLTQHEFVEAERKLLGRGDKELTSLTGYAGGKSTDKEGRVCYHNFQSIADYGKLGHGEVVGMKIPESSIGDFSKEYFDLFTPKGERVDPMDRGGEYRSLIGLPGGVKNPRYAEVEAAATAKGMTLEAGKGNDPDTLGKKMVFVYDTAKFPFYQAEVYHQFHNDFQSPAYGKKYNDLVKEAVEDGRVKITGCPDRI